MWMHSGVSFWYIYVQLCFDKIQKFTSLILCSLKCNKKYIQKMMQPFLIHFDFNLDLQVRSTSGKLKSFIWRKDMLQPQQHQASNMPASSIPTPKKIASHGTSSALPVYQPPSHTTDTAANYNHSNGPSQQLKGFKSNMQPQQSFIAHFVSSESRNSGRIFN